MNPSLYVASFQSEAPDALRLGGKGASLCRLAQLGHRVPPGFVVPVDAFRDTCDQLGLAEELAGITRALAHGDDAAARGAAAQGRLREGRIGDEVMAPIRRAVDELGLWNGSSAHVLVRSSATVEDGTAHSFAGIFDSIPITTPDSLERSIREVWSSVFSARALAYCGVVGLAAVPGMAVVVQQFVEAERSGVMFTRFRGRTLVEHVEGGCEKLVKGEVTPEQLWIAGPGAAPEETGQLGIEHAGELSRLAASLERQLGAPQDVEWVLVDNSIHIVQARPITTPTSRPGGEAASPEVAGHTPVLTGTPASGGWGSGPVRLVFNIEDALRLETGQVLVTTMTNPDMVVAMRKSAAIVTDVGGMICHAAIVSRELGLPCVVGTASATTALRAGETVSVSGTTGSVYRGRPDDTTRGAAKRPARWSDLWSVWDEATADRPDLVPILSSADALATIPVGVSELVLVPDVDLRCDAMGRWEDLEGMDPAGSDALISDYLDRTARLGQERDVERIYLLPLDPGVAGLVAPAVRARPRPPLLVHADEPRAPTVALGSDPPPPPPPPAGRVAIPLGTAALLGRSSVGSPLPGMDVATAAALDTLKFFGHQPGSSRGPMPSFDQRRRWWALLPEYGRYHREFATAAEEGQHTWLEVRPELVISPLLKSLVQPGFEMVPRVMGFPGVPPMHVKWIRCRYHFRSDTFAQVWQAIVRATWSPSYMTDLMQRVRRSYQQLAEVLAVFPDSDQELANAPAEQIAALITSWWPRWVEFFALCWFIQAQGDDIVAPFLQETIDDHVARLSRATDEFAWPGIPELMAPTTPVMSGAYMASVGRLRESLLSAGLTTRDEALVALDRGDHPEVGALLAEHLRHWRWMRDRDLLFEPWDTPARVIETALNTDPHAPPDYAGNLRTNRLALSVHVDIAHLSGRASGLNHAARVLHDLNVEREDHHLLWLKCSYPLRRLVVEVERRLVALGNLETGDVFFLQAPELIDAVRRLPFGLPPELVGRVKQRRLAYRHEARLAEADPAQLRREDDYY